MRFRLSLAFSFFIFYILIVISSITAVQSKEPQVIEINLETQENLPVVFHQELQVHGDTAYIKEYYDVKQPLENFICKHILSSPRKITVWDYELLVNNSLNLKKWFVETKIINDTYRTELECGKVKTPAEIFRTYKIKGIIKEVRGKIWYPFDIYSINYSWEVGDYPILYSVKIILPQNTFPEENMNLSGISGPVMNFKELQLVEINKTTGKIIKPLGKVGLFLFGTEFRPAITSFNDKNYFIILPQVGLASKNWTISNQKVVRVMATWERPFIVKFIWVISLFLILFSALFFLIQRKIFEYISCSIVIWGFQEGINQLLPVTRPLNTLTLFELPIVVSIVIIVLYSLIKIRSLNKR